MFRATTGNMHADRVKTRLLFGGAQSSAYKRTEIHTRQAIQDIVYHTSTVESQQLLRPLSYAQRAPDGTAPVGKFTAPWQVSTGS